MSVLVWRMLFEATNLAGSVRTCASLGTLSSPTDATSVNRDISHQAIIEVQRTVPRGVAALGFLFGIN